MAICVYITDSLRCITEINTVKQLYSNKKKLFKKKKKKQSEETSLVVQWLRLRALSAGLGSIPDQGTRSSHNATKDPV